MKRLLPQALCGVLLLLLRGPGAAAQPDTAQQAFSLQEAIEYGIRNSRTLMNNQLDIENAKARVQEIKGIGLPQLAGSFAYTNNIIVPRFFVPANTFNPQAPAGETVALKFGVNHSGTAGVGFSQLIFDGSYLIGLKATKVYIDLSTRTLNASKITVAENVTKAYYNVLVNRERLKLLDVNVSRLDTFLRDTRAFQREGFAEKLDVQRLEVQANNLKIEQQNVQQLQELALGLLKFQMSYPMELPIVLTDSLSRSMLEQLAAQDTVLAGYNNRIEYQQLLTQRAFQELDIRNVQAGYYPRVALSGNYGYNTGRDQFTYLITKPWFNSAALTLNVNIPIFDGFQRKYKLAQSRNNLLKIDNQVRLLEQSIDLQVSQAQIQLRNYWRTLDSQQRNLDLAEEVVRVSRIKYKEGVGSNLEIINAEAGFKEAQTNYFNALYNAIIAKVDIDKATGRLYASPRN